jgi:hypothetical protein
VIAPGTPLEIKVREPSPQHTVTVGQLGRWCDGVSVNPADMLSKAKMKALLKG